MKPFRGKPKKPKRSNGEIHRQRRWLRVGGRCSAEPLRDPTADTLPCADVRRSSSCTSPLVGRRDPLGVGLRPGCGDCRVAGKTARGKPPVARPAARRYTHGIRPHSRIKRGVCASRPSQARATLLGDYTDLAPCPVLARCWSYGTPSTGLLTRQYTGRRRYCFGYS